MFIEFFYFVLKLLDFKGQGGQWCLGTLGGLKKAKGLKSKKKFCCAT